MNYLFQYSHEYNLYHLRRIAGQARFRFLSCKNLVKFAHLIVFCESQTHLIGIVQLKKLFILILTAMLALSAEGQENKRYKGLAVIGLPQLSYRQGEGLEYGGGVYFYQYGQGNLQPYLWNGICQGSRTTQDRVDLSLLFDSPHFMRSDSRFDLLLEYKQFIYDDFFGIGNHSAYHSELTEKQNARFVNEHFYTFRHNWVMLMINWQKPIWQQGFKALIGAGFYHTDIAPQSAETAFGLRQPFGSKGGRTSFLRVGLVSDHRDQEAVPSTGHWSDMLVERTFPFLQSDYSYTRITITDRRYRTLLPDLVYAQRILLEAMPGNPPFYEMSVIASSYQRFDGLGGAKSLRGIPRHLFLGPTKFLTNIELRWRIMDWVILKQPLTFYLHPFMDIGRVWLKNDKFRLANLHFSEGLGLHVRWKKDFIAALDIGRSRYLDYAVYTTFGNLF
jgi:hypothetical protein